MKHLNKVILPPELGDRLRDGADLVISMSGGKDSDALALVLRELYRLNNWSGRLHIIHADLGRNDWSQTPVYLQQRAQALHLPLTIVRRERGDLLDRWWQRHETRPEVPPWSDARNRFCTSELKVGPINQWLRAWKPSGTVICAMGLRAAESPGRARKPIWSVREAVSTHGRQVYNWNPLHAVSTEEVWEMLGVTQTDLRRVREEVQHVQAHGGSVQEAIVHTGWSWHPAYALGNERLSCSLCVLASKNDLLNGAQHHSQHYRDLVELEIASGFSFRQGMWLADLRPDLLTGEQRRNWRAYIVRMYLSLPRPLSPLDPCNCACLTNDAVALQRLLRGYLLQGRSRSPLFFRRCTACTCTVRCPHRVYRAHTKVRTARWHERNPFRVYCIANPHVMRLPPPMQCLYGTVQVVHTLRTLYRHRLTLIGLLRVSQQRWISLSTPIIAENG